MSVFAVFRRKVKPAAEEPTDEARTAEATAGELVAGTAADGAAGAETGEPDAESTISTAAEVEIPRQQSVAAAADNEVGDAVRK
ncbi:hypothetical protein AB0M87_10040 [Streptomyces sp. NPDC051320]|uniref:hypothetical protein n=1 Tax=Streptomyces sp. NPDC051320 TaxID=3154644 RepID=UPI00343492BB